MRRVVIFVMLVGILFSIVLAGSELRFREFKLLEATKEDVMRIEGKPFAQTKIGYFDTIVYKNKVLNQDALVFYIFKNNVLVIGMYRIEFDMLDLTTGKVREKYETLERILTKKYGRPIYKSFGQVEKLFHSKQDEDTLWLGIQSGMSQLTVGWVPSIDLTKVDISKLSSMTPDEMMDFLNDQSVIFVSITPDIKAMNCSFMVVYTYTNMMMEFSKQMNKKEEKNF